ncbi:nucleotidyltransferase substrate binding protein, HI0074 family [Tindallia magadiensis]|uniref:Nucleotidyltransferase substrate binding protein, HI0074 family n=1 Tax=Tindallia magadiensis TaxID=69895 RepID=A0A1I3GEN0_9FIRM|nr:nucleotidyltransferase substrate binding protein [Tindallia magadiensis]SFI21946.1 nucleotidyltransferase substrate binding protein, HI0074 family [Tindallia magadiensis]
MNRYDNKRRNFKNALERLKEAVEEFRQEDSGDVVRDGLIQRFEFTYELSWKTTKEYLEILGIPDRNSPKAVLKEAYAQKLINNEENWLLMLNDRNMTSHVYKEEMAEEIAERISNCYVKEFETLLERLEQESE